MRHVAIVCAAWLCSGLVAHAGTYAEKVTAIDPEKRTLTIPIDGKDRSLKVDASVDVQSQVRVGKRLRLTHSMWRRRRSFAPCWCESPKASTASSCRRTAS